MVYLEPKLMKASQGRIVVNLNNHHHAAQVQMCRASTESSDFSVQKTMIAYAKKNWQTSMPSCPGGVGVGSKVWACE